MKHSTRLADLLQSTFGLHRPRVTCLAQLATAFPGTAEIDSHYRRSQRFFQYLQLQPARVTTCALAFLPDAPYTLALDRIQWMLGDARGCVGDRVLLGLARGGLAARGQSDCAQGASAARQEPDSLWLRRHSPSRPQCGRRLGAV